MDSEALFGTPATDSGTETLRRFEYQAKLIFPFVLRCSLDGPELSVIPEHIEDCFLERSDGWFLLQIKSRDASQGYWTLSDLLQEPGGALRSLFRSYLINPGAAATYWMLLEQAISPHGDVAHLRTTAGRTNQDLINALVKALEATEPAVRDFLAKLRVRDSLPPREHVDAVNIHLLMAQGSRVTYEAARRIYERSVREIEAAMKASPTGVEWPTYTRDVEATDLLKAKVALKRLSRERCKEIVGPIGSAISALLTRELDATLPAPTNLERKLLAGGATSEIIENAKELRARAVMVESEKLARALVEDSDLAAIQKRVLMHGNAVVAKHAQAPNPAIHVWNELLFEFPKLSEKLDPNSVFYQDGYLALGELCELSDQCLIGWGVKNA